MTYEEFKSEWLSNSEYIHCLTSGSTGTPANILLPKREMIRSALRTCEFFDISESSHLHSCISPDYIGGKMMMVRSCVSNAQFTFETPSNRPLTGNIENSIDLVSVVPSQMLYILEHHETLSKVKNYLIGGAAIHPEIREKIVQNGLSAFESYGMTETASHIALRKIGKDDSGFIPLPGVTVCLHEDNRLGIIIDGWKEFITNDVAEILPDKSFKILGRADNVINTGGKKVHPEDLEKRIGKYLNIPFFISSRMDIKWGERIVFVTSDYNLSSQKILDTCHDILAPWEMPKEVIRINELPLTPNGKIKRSKFYCKP